MAALNLQSDVSVYVHGSLSDTTDQIYGDHETQVSEGREADLHRHVVECEKNQGHKNFIPVNEFNLYHLPKGHLDKDLYELIKASFDLTVRVDVKMTSLDRPEFWPKTNVSYPFYGIRNTPTLRFGSGMVSSRVNKFTDGYRAHDGQINRDYYTQCWCKKCQQLEQGSNVWWEFFVDTATHVVFDEIEAHLTSLRLFYDCSKCPEIYVDQVSVESVNIENDFCKLKCVTCDENLAEKLNKWEHFSDAWGKIYSKYRKTRDLDKLSFIVSHPHGCSKQVSVGRWVGKNNIGNLSQFTYTTSTCPGSSGAPVHCVGYEVGGWMDQLVHSGCSNSKLNYSGIGFVF